MRTRKIDSDKLKAAAEHLEWTLHQHHGSDQVETMMTTLAPLIADAKNRNITKPFTDQQKIPFEWSVSADGHYREYKNPSIESAYVAFTIELRGGLTEEDEEINSIIDKLRGNSKAGNQS